MLGEESVVVEVNINDQDVEVLDDIIGSNLEFVLPEEVEIFKFLVVIADDSSLGGDIDVKVVSFDLLNGKLGLNNDVVLVLNKDDSLFGFSLGNDLESIGFDLDDGISSE